MARIRKIEIRNFRSIGWLDWFPLAGINCLIGPGDSGKSTILDAIDFCLGARRNLAFCDDDFHRLQLGQPIQISITLGELDSHLRSMEAYGLYLRGFDFQSGAIEDEPGSGLETVLTVELTVGDDLEPQWQLVSGRAAALGQSRNLSWADRIRLAPTRLGQSGEHNLSWKRGSILNKVSEERASAASAIAQAARDARIAFGDKAKDQLGEALEAVQTTAGRLGVPIAGQVQALLDAHGVNFTGGTISLHGGDGVPLPADGHVEADGALGPHHLKAIIPMPASPPPASDRGKGGQVRGGFYRPSRKSKVRRLPPPVGWVSRHPETTSPQNFHHFRDTTAMPFRTKLP